MRTWDVIIIGGGIIGLSLAISLRKRGATVLVVDRGEPGREASHAAGGMLVDSPLETSPPLLALATASALMYPEFAYELEVESGMKVDLRDQGAIVFPSPDHRSQQPASGFLSAAELAQLEPELTYSEQRALRLKERSVDPRALTAASLKAARHRGVDFSSSDPVTSLNIRNGRAVSVTTTKTSFNGHKIVNCAGAWAGQIGPQSLPTRPVKGQILCLAMPSRGFLIHVIRSDVYLIPRSDGRLLIGATVEEAGFDKRTDPATIKRLHNAALALVPKLRDAKILEDWAGLRPGTPDNLPIIGATSTPGYYVATGHFRDGILLAPITAHVMTSVLEGHRPEHDLSAFNPHRFS